MTIKTFQIKKQLLLLLMGCIMVAGIMCFCILWVYSSSNAFQTTSSSYVNAYQQLKWLYNQEGNLSEDYFYAVQQDYFRQLEKDGANVYFFEDSLKNGEDFSIRQIYATDNFSNQYHELTEKEQGHLLTVAKSDKRKPVLAAFKRKKVHPVILYGNLQGNKYIGVISQKDYLNMDTDAALIWSIVGFLVFAGIATGIIFGFGKRLDATMIRLDNANRSLAKELEQKEQMYMATKSMLANVSHDLKTPVTLIQVHIEALKDNIYPDLERETLYDTIASETQHLSNLINRIVVLAKLEGAIQTLRPTVFSLYDLTMTCYQRFLLPIREKNIQVVLPKDEEMLIMADYGMTEQVILNLLENAVTYTDDGGTIRLFYEEIPDTIRMSLFNTHSPISDENLSRLFQNFYRNEHSRSQKGHYGLGLAIVKSAVSLMGGRYGAYNDSEGIVFYVEFPAGKIKI